MGTSETLRDYGRLDINLKKSLVKEVLPEYFQTSFPNLVTFLEGYYDIIDSDNDFGGIINELLTIRDVQDIQLKRIDLLLDEIALGVGRGNFTFPREALLNFGNFFRVKGSMYSAEGFFRGFFQEDVEVQFPKDRLMRIGDSKQGEIGAEADLLLQDGNIFQIFSVLIKSPLSFKDWEELYRLFVHPTGFHLAAETLIEGKGSVEIVTAESITDPRSSFTNVFCVGSLSFGDPIASTTILIPDDDDADSAQQRVNPIKTALFFDSANISIDSLGVHYTSLGDVIGYNVRFDDSSDSSGAMNFSCTFETMDNAQFQTFSYGSTSTV